MPYLQPSMLFDRKVAERGALFGDTSPTSSASQKTPVPVMVLFSKVWLPPETFIGARTSVNTALVTVALPAFSCSALSRPQFGAMPPPFCRQTCDPVGVVWPAKLPPEMATEPPSSEMASSHICELETLDIRWP